MLPRQRAPLLPLVTFTLFLSIATLLLPLVQGIPIFGWFENDDDVRNDIFAFSMPKDAVLFAGRDALEFHIRSAQNVVWRTSSPLLHPKKLVYAVRFDKANQDNQDKYLEWYLNEDPAAMNRTGFKLTRDQGQILPIRPLNGPWWKGYVPIPANVSLAQDNTTLIIHGYHIRANAARESLEKRGYLQQQARSPAFSVVTELGQGKLAQCHKWLKLNHPEELHRWKLAFQNGFETSLRYHVVAEHIDWRKVDPKSSCDEDWFDELRKSAS